MRMPFVGKALFAWATIRAAAVGMRLGRRLPRSVALAAMGALNVPAAAEPPYPEVPIMVASNPAVFRDIFLSSSSGVVRVAVLGDSQETCPGQWGRHYIMQINALMARSFGPVSETMLFSPEWWWSDPAWLATSAAFGEAPPPAEVADSQLLPGMSPRALVPATSGGGPFVTVFLPRAQEAITDELRDQPWFVEGTPVVADVLVAKRSSASQLAWESAPTTMTVPDATAAAVAAGSWSILPYGADGRVDWYSTPPLSAVNGGQVQLRLVGAGQEPVDCLGVRYRAVGESRGVVVHSFSKGGMRIADFLSQHGSSGEAFRAIAPHIVVLHWGANDSTWTSTAQWRQSLLDTISAIRSAAADPMLPIIIAGDPPRYDVPADSPFLEFAAVAADLALGDPRVLALNLRRAEEEAFAWDADLNLAMADLAHYRPHGQRMLAYAFVGSLLEGLGIPMHGVAAGASWRDAFYPLGASCTIDFPCHRLVEEEAVLAGRPWTSGTDCSDLDGDSLPDVCVSPGSPDINADGTVNGADLLAVLGAWGQSGAAADCSNDGTVNAVDLAMVINAWGTAG